MYDLLSLGQNAKKASIELIKLSEQKRAETLLEGAKMLRQNADYLMAENTVDIENAKKKGMSDAFIDRLALTSSVIEGMAIGLEQVATLESPLGQEVYSHENKEQGISIVKKNVPFGVVGIIYESRPNVTADAFALCFKTANAVILKGGSDSLRSNIAIVKVLKMALKNMSVDQNAISVIEDTSRETTTEFMKLNKYVDLLIPRGSASLIRATMENSTIPIIETGTGNCHIYVDEFADVDMSASVIFNAKTQRYSVCNACESLVIHSKIIKNALPKIAERLKEKQVVIRADERSYDIIKDYPYLEIATEEDFYTEYGKAMISVKTVDNIEEAISHINEHNTRHSESIITENEDNAQKFLDEIDASSVYHNASTRFTDGFVFGLGAEIGISTQKLHARGPMGLSALVTTKYYIKGDGAVRK
ncbi:MAG: glutamate-5-semialdehyde dehydrogenase [Clostridiales bacterium]|nr:glutamate-5-semialdehyde dehydrogenase [Clostridiales bacterium]